MDVDTLLTRQMELHTSVRHPPKNPQGLVQLMDVMRNYKNYFESLRRIAGQFNVEPETVFQALMYISVGGTVNFDRQHQDGSVPMHQAKVLARSNAIELSSTLRKDLPNSELMVYVGLSRDLRTTLRVKVEDGNDLKTAEASVREAVEYLNYIDRCAHHSPEKLFKFYMAEDPASLTALLNESDPLAMTQTMTGSTMRGSGVALQAVLDEDGADAREPTPLPSPLSSFLPELKAQCALAGEASATSSSSASGGSGATRRLKAAQVVLDWVTAVPVEYFAEHAEEIVAAVSSTLSQLATEKRSALCRAGCEVITVLMQRLSPEPVFLADVDRGTCSTNPETFSGALAQWTGALAKGIYVTVAAISTAADATLRAVAVQGHGHLCVVKKLLAVLAAGTQTELRRKCLGYLALCVASAHAHNPESMRGLMPLLGPVAVDYVSIGDSPSRKMARALCSVLRVLAPDASPTSRGALAIADERIEHLVQQERPQVEPAVLGGPQDLEELLFEADAFVSSTRSSFSNSTSRHSGAAAATGAGADGRGWCGSGEVVRGRRRVSGQPPLASRTSAAARPLPAAAKRSAGEPPRVPTPVRRSAPQPGSKPAGHALGELHSPNRRRVPSGTKADNGDADGSGQRGSVSSHNAKTLAEKERSSFHQPKGQPPVQAGNDGVYDTDTFLSSDSVSKRNARPDGRGGSSNTPTPTATSHVMTGHSSQDNAHATAAAAVVEGCARGTATHGTALVLPSLASQPRRGTVPSESPSIGADGTREPGRHSSGHHHQRSSNVQLGVDRPVPLSLRDGSGCRYDDDDAPPLGAGAAAEPAGTVRISRSLRRKIEENKAGQDSMDDARRVS
ncbi:hypothetical protein N2W54_006226 [Lotmaria passim]